MVRRSREATGRARHRSGFFSGCGGVSEAGGRLRARSSKSCHSSRLTYTSAHAANRLRMIDGSNPFLTPISRCRSMRICLRAERDAPHGYARCLLNRCRPPRGSPAEIAGVTGRSRGTRRQSRERPQACAAALSPSYCEFPCGPTPLRISNMGSGEKAPEQDPNHSKSGAIRGDRRQPANSQNQQKT